MIYADIYRLLLVLWFVVEGFAFGEWEVGEACRVKEAAGFGEGGGGDVGEFGDFFGEAAPDGICLRQTLTPGPSPRGRGGSGEIVAA